jgi:hypothetical protein
LFPDRSAAFAEGTEEGTGSPEYAIVVFIADAAAAGLVVAAGLSVAKVSKKQTRQI